MATHINKLTGHLNQSKKLSRTLILFLFGLSALAQDCLNPDYSLSDCYETKGNTRAAYLFFEEPQKCVNESFEKLKPIEDIPCQYECNSGEYLFVDTQTRDYSCKKCPKNTYSNGGGYSIDGYFGEWETALNPDSEMSRKTSLSRNCYQYYWFSWFQKDCEPCSTTPGGASFTCGEASVMETSVAFETILKVYFVKKGKIEFQYTKDSTKESDGWISGLFQFFIDDIAVLEDQSLNDDPSEWKSFSYEVYPGMKELTFMYQKYNSDQNKDMRLELKSLRITGTEYSDLECRQCSFGYSLEGSDRCSLCPSDYYLNPLNSECMQCPDGTHSQEGSIAKQAQDVCKVKRDCSEDEIPKTYTQQCYQQAIGSFIKYYRYNEDSAPMETCSVKQDVDFIKKFEVPCLNCINGQFLDHMQDDEYMCRECPENSFSNKESKYQCKQCNAGKYIQSGISITRFEQFPSEHGFSTFCLSGISMSFTYYQLLTIDKAADNYCSESDGFMAVYSQGLVAGRREIPGSTLYLVSNLTISEDNQMNEATYRINFGTVNFEYEKDSVSLYLDNKLQMVQMKTGQFGFAIALTEGKHQFKVYYIKQSKESYVVINSIEIVGSHSTKKTNLACIDCPIGYYQNEVGKHECLPCQMGFQSNDDKTGCQVCPDGFYTPSAGSPCLKCPINTYPSADHKNCIVENHIALKSSNGHSYLYHFSFFDTYLNENSSTAHNSLNYKLCKSQGGFCQNNFFGPLITVVEQNNSWYTQNFYISPKAPANFSKIYELEFEQTQDVLFKPNSFILGLFDEKLVQQYVPPATQATSNNDAEMFGRCKNNLQAKNQKIIKSVGTSIAGINIHDSGYTIQYRGGDKCFFKKNLYDFSSEIRYVCDHYEQEGWPLLLTKTEDNNVEESDPCHLVFEWRTKLACRHCQTYEVTEVDGACIWYQREISQNPAKTCSIYSHQFVDDILNSNQTFNDVKIDRSQFAYRRSYVDSCSPIEDFMRNKTVMMIIVVLFVGLSLIFVCCSFVFCRYRRMKYQYYERVNLLRGGPGNRNTEDRSREYGESNFGGNAASNNGNNAGANAGNAAGKRQIIYKINDEDE
ncbi:UNKNOWN [Stylonychia lemnae]|uniref:MRH domain-containing protein n=1 Tax=Stylonychia lemnae TaxID=5949 RepID=A0A078A6D6_STYLE|nr:UNKNOWN [Stylonychia lemnae]|eukprot:CDW77764.1 UNKNOWN [Stylonychia lemnae]